MWIRTKNSISYLRDSFREINIKIHLYFCGHFLLEFRPYSISLFDKYLFLLRQYYIAFAKKSLRQKTCNKQTTIFCIVPCVLNVVFPTTCLSLHSKSAIKTRSHNMSPQCNASPQLVNAMQSAPKTNPQAKVPHNISTVGSVPTTIPQCEVSPKQFHNGKCPHNNSTMGSVPKQIPQWEVCPKQFHNRKCPQKNSTV